MRLLFSLICLFLAGIAYQLFPARTLGLEGWGAMGSRLHSLWSWSIVLNAVPLLLAGFRFFRPEWVRWTSVVWGAWVGGLSSLILLGASGIPSPPSFRGLLYVLFVWLISLSLVAAGLIPRKKAA